MDVHPTKHVSIGIDPYPYREFLNEELECGASTLLKQRRKKNWIFVLFWNIYIYRDYDFSVCRTWRASTLNVRLHKQCVDNGCFCLLNHLPICFYHMYPIFLISIFISIPWYWDYSMIYLWYKYIPFKSLWSPMVFHGFPWFFHGFSMVFPAQFIPAARRRSTSASSTRRCESWTAWPASSGASRAPRVGRPPRFFGRWNRFLPGFGLSMMVIFRYDYYICTYHINGYIYIIIIQWYIDVYNYIYIYNDIYIYIYIYNDIYI